MLEIILITSFHYTTALYLIYFSRDISSTLPEDVCKLTNLQYNVFLSFLSSICLYSLRNRFIFPSSSTYLLDVMCCYSHRFTIYEKENTNVLVFVL